MDERRITTLEDIRQFLAGVGGTGLALQGYKDDASRWMEPRFKQKGNSPTSPVSRFAKRPADFAIT